MELIFGKLISCGVNEPITSLARANSDLAVHHSCDVMTIMNVTTTSLQVVEMLVRVPDKTWVQVEILNKGRPEMSL